MLTPSVPKSKLNGILRSGRRISAAVYVMMFHADELKIAPTIANPTADKSVELLRGTCVMSFFKTIVLKGCQKWAAFQCAASLPQPAATPSKIKPMSAAIFVIVNVFCSSFPKETPRVFKKVRKMMTANASNCVAVKVYSPILIKTFCSEKIGKMTAVNFAKAIETAAIKPVSMTKNVVQPNKKPTNAP